ncbi:PepSY domain-containing protein [Chitinophaga nivalis]|uniref:PepSY domain-containing protein n=1 Tax=Chitinophaga nivalis TaxID=2991709 RepID=A0ABT3IQ72_9BACT|nr:PepSY domain-containing protein [Chitinophaga nivalis]MCW3464203.1 PepSY domain-containing protein [Chitinophaga nivalis]MCW3486107.1 PepSY domain-containing protein [Chitinophaga nivalis]
MAKSKHYYIRQSHRYLGLLLGIQFLLWTIGGLYFSWSNMDEIHGDFQKRPAAPLPVSAALVSPSVPLTHIREQGTADTIMAIQLIRILDKPYYQIKGKGKSYLADAITGNLRPALTQTEAVEVATQHFNGAPAITAVEYLTSTNGHHEYREGALPAYAVTFGHRSGTTVYVSAALGTVQKFRNNKWRMFDFLWMLHTMDYQGRDNFGNLLLRLFSIFGLVTVVSGFILYGMSSRLFKKRKPLKRPVTAS